MRYRAIGITALVAIIGGAALAQLAKVAPAEKPAEKPKVSRWIVACETRPDDEAKAVKAKAGTLKIDGAKCYRTGSTGTRDLYTCEGRDAAKIKLTDRACIVYEYDGIKSIPTTDAKGKTDPKKVAEKEALVKGSTCIGEASMTWRKRVKSYQIWPCAWNDRKPGFVAKRIDRYGPGVIRGGSLRRIVGLDRVDEKPSGGLTEGAGAGTIETTKKEGVK